jgi:hypothetical protein
MAIFPIRAENRRVFLKNEQDPAAAVQNLEVWGSWDICQDRNRGIFR